MEIEQSERLKGDHKLKTSYIIKRLFKYAKKEWVRFLVASIFILINVGLDIVCPWIISKVTDILTNLQPNSAPSDALWMIIMFSVGYIVIGVINQLFLYLETMMLQKAGQNIVYDLRMEVFTHIEHMSQDQFNEMPVGSLVTRVANYTTSVSDLFANTITNLARNIITIISVYVMMVIMSWALSLILLSIMALVFVISFIFRIQIAKIFRNERKCVSDLNTYLNENLSGMRITQIFNQQKRKKDDFENKNKALFSARYRMVIAFGIYRPTISFLYYASIAVTFIVGIQDWSILAPGTVVGFYLYLSRFFNPIQNIADQINNIQKAMTAAERLFNLLDVLPQVLDKPNAISVDHFNGKIEFKNVWFAYEKEDWILKDVSFVIEPKTTAAFVGATGAGKTTILSLIVRNHEIQKGQILIDDIDITTIKVESLRSLIGQMLQDVFLFSGNIRDNITLHDTNYTDEEINEACAYVNADKFINNLPKKLDEEVIERGENFSQGQRQLLSFARTVLSKPEILILDEATANIDTETEVLIQESLEKMKSIGTMLVVAHRLSTIQKADQIFVLQQGVIIEHGNHQELLKQKGQYYKLYQLQFEEN